MTALERWGEDLRAWAIPEPILAAAPEPPYGFPTEAFRRRAEAAGTQPATPTTERALEALPEGGIVLDVGVGAGSTSLPLAERAGRVTGVDTSQELLDAFREVASSSSVRIDVVAGSWPDAALRVGAADVVVCGHVVYNVQDLGPFLTALTDHARARVVIELTGSHPWAWMNDLWLRFHGLARPSGPTADGAEASLRELGIDPGRADRVDAGTRSGVGFAERGDAVALVRRRLCLPPERDDEVAQALGDRLRRDAGAWSAGPREQQIVTLWWDGTA